MAESNLLETLSWQYVESSNIQRIAFLRTGEIPQRDQPAIELGFMMVEFRGDSIYAYYNVLRPVYECILEAESPGRAFNKVVKSCGKYKRVK